jgi:hypothetical protein
MTTKQGTCNSRIAILVVSESAQEFVLGRRGSVGDRSSWGIDALAFRRASVRGRRTFEHDVRPGLFDVPLQLLGGERLCFLAFRD